MDLHHYYRDPKTVFSPSTRYWKPTPQEPQAHKDFVTSSLPENPADRILKVSLRRIGERKELTLAPKAKLSVYSSEWLSWLNNKYTHFPQRMFGISSLSSSLMLRFLELFQDYGVSSDKQSSELYTLLWPLVGQALLGHSREWLPDVHTKFSHKRQGILGIIVVQLLNSHLRPPNAWKR